jgi:hypothetical protein
VNAATLLVRALADPKSVAGLDADRWTQLLAAARAEQLIGSLAHRLQGHAMPASARAILNDAAFSAEQGQTHARWEAEMARRALAPTDMRVVLLKGTAFVVAGLDAGVGRFVGDLDILVSRNAIDVAERALLAAGWEWVKDDPYDSAYYRRWMHELPPMIHSERDRMIDVHHTILPLTAGPRPDAAALIADSVLLENGLYALSPADMIVHASAHLLADGDLAGGLRNLWDIDRLVRQFSTETGFWKKLRERSHKHQLADAVGRALRLSARLYETPIDRQLAGHPRLADRLYARRLLARDGWGRQTRKFTRFLFYVRSHWIRMPPLMLARHLWTKARRSA